MVWDKHLIRNFYKLSLIVIAILLVLIYHPSATALTAKHYTELEFPPLKQVQIPKYDRYELPNGMVVYLMPDRDLPLVGGTAIIRTGDRWEPDDKVGLANLTGVVLRTGGTQKHSADELNQLLEQRAAAVETGINNASGFASFSALSEDLEMVFGLFAEVLQQPVFAQEKLDLAKTQVRGSIARRNDDPNGIVGREFQKLVYGNDSPYARTVEYATLENISRQDLVNFYRQYFYPNNLILGIAGDFDVKNMRSLIQKYFSNWQPKLNLSQPQIPIASQSKLGGLFFVDRPQLTQSHIQIGHLGGQFNSPDYPALDVMNQVLNGFGGRLFNSVRSRQGLAYSVYGIWSPRFDYPGLFVAGGQTRSTATVPFLRAIRSEIAQLQTETVQPEELQRAKESVLNSFVFNFEQPSQTLSRLMRYEYFGYPTDFLFRYQRSVQATTAAEVRRVAKKYLQPEKLVTLVVGNSTAIQPPLTAIAPEVIPIEIAIPSAQPG
jgi:zinc protease